MKIRLFDADPLVIERSLLCNGADWPLDGDRVQLSFNIALDR